jgi:hypothetical protein
VQVITVPDGWPMGPRRYDRAAATTPRPYAPTLRSCPALTEATSHLRALGDLGYEEEADTITVAFKKPKDSILTEPSRAPSGERRPFRTKMTHSKFLTA